MSIKLIASGGVFPTYVADGKLHIKFCDNDISYTIPLLNTIGNCAEDITYFPISNIMFIVKNDSSAIVGRFDGTITRYDSEGIVTGFNTFNADEILNTFNVKRAGNVQYKVRLRHKVANMFIARMYKIPGSNDKFAVDSVDDPRIRVCEAIYNKQYIYDVETSFGIKPILISENGLLYCAEGDYFINGDTIEPTGRLDL